MRPQIHLARLAGVAALLAPVAVASAATLSFDFSSDPFAGSPSPFYDSTVGNFASYDTNNDEIDIVSANEQVIFKQRPIRDGERFTWTFRVDAEFATSFIWTFLTPNPELNTRFIDTTDGVGFGYRNNNSTSASSRFTRNGSTQASNARGNIWAPGQVYTYSIKRDGNDFNMAFTGNNAGESFSLTNATVGATQNLYAGLGVYSGAVFSITSFEAQVIPEPGILASSLALGGLGVTRRRRG